MKTRQRWIAWTLTVAAVLVAMGWGTTALLRFAESEAELKARLSDEEVNALIAWGRGTAIAAHPSRTSWEGDELPDELRRVGVRGATTSRHSGDTGVFFHLQSKNGKSGLLVMEPTAKWPDPPADWSLWRPGLWYHRE